MARKEENGVGIRAGKMLYPIFMGQVIGFILTAVTFIVVARMLGPSDYGVYTFATSFYTLLNAFLAFGVGGYLTYALPKFLFKKNYEGMLRAITSSYVIAFAVSGTLTIIGLALSGYVSGTFTGVGASPTLLMVSASIVIVWIISAVPTNILIGLSRSWLSSLIGVFMLAAQLVLSVVLILHFSVMGSILAIFLAYALSIVPGAYFIYKAISKYCKPRIVLPSMGEIRRTFNFVWPMGITNFLNYGVPSFALIFLGLFVTPTVLGNYGSASKALSLLAMIYGTFGLGLLPIFEAVKELKPKREINRIYHKIMNLELIIILPMMVFACVMAVPILHLFIGGNYTTAPLYFVLIVIGSAIWLFGGYVNYLLITENHTIGIIKVNAISAVVQFGLVFILVPYATVLGMIAAIFFIGNILEAFLFAREARSKFGMRFNLRRILMLYTGAILLGLVLALAYLGMNYFLLIQPLDLKYLLELAVGVALSLLLYPAILIAIGAVSREELNDMRTSTRKLGKVSRIFGGFFDYTEYIHDLLIIE